MSIAQSVTGLLQRFGVDVVINRRIYSAYSPASDTRKANDYQITVRCVATTRNTMRGGGSYAQSKIGSADSGNVVIQGFFFGPDEPIAMGDTFTYNWQKYSIDSCIELAVSGDIIGYKVTAKR